MSRLVEVLQIFSQRLTMASGYYIEPSPISHSPFGADREQKVQDAVGYMKAIKSMTEKTDKAKLIPSQLLERSVRRLRKGAGLKTLN